jgi:hypothetical protein
MPGAEYLRWNLCRQGERPGRDGPQQLMAKLSVRRPAGV